MSDGRSVTLDGTPFLHLPVPIWQTDPIYREAEAMVGTELLARLPLLTYTLSHSTNRSELCPAHQHWGYSSPAWEKQQMKKGIG